MANLALAKRSYVTPYAQAGGIDGKSIYIDTEGTFRPERIAEIAKARGFDPDMTLNNVIIEALDSAHQEKIIEKISSTISNDTDSKKFKLLMVDSPVTLIGLSM